MERDKRRQSLRILVLTIAIALVLIFFISEDLDQVRNLIRQTGWFGMVIAVALYGLLGASPIPSEPLTVVLSSIFGPFQAMLVATIGNLLAALMEFFVGTKIGDIASFEKQKAKLPFGLGKFPVNSPIFLVGARSIPGYGPKFVSIIAGIYHVPMWRYIWTSFISNLWGAAIVSYGGFGLLHMHR